MIFFGERSICNSEFLFFIKIVKRKNMFLIFFPHPHDDFHIFQSLNNVINKNKNIYQITFFKTSKNFGFEGKFLSITTDNSKNMVNGVV